MHIICMCIYVFRQLSENRCTLSQLFGTSFWSPIGFCSTALFSVMFWVLLCVLCGTLCVFCVCVCVGVVWNVGWEHLQHRPLLLNTSAASMEIIWTYSVDWRPETVSRFSFLFSPFSLSAASFGGELFICFSFFPLKKNYIISCISLLLELFFFFFFLFFHFSGFVHSVTDSVTPHHIRTHIKTHHCTATQDGLSWLNRWDPLFQVPPLTAPH